MRALYFAVEPRRARADVDVPDVERFQMPVELRLKLGTVIGLHHLNPKWQALPHLVDKSTGTPA
jgi:hypothetical protein